MNDRKYGYLNKRKAIPCPAGSRLKPQNIVVTKGNNLTLKQVGQIDVYQQIQSYEDSTCLARMIERFSCGDSSALNRRGGFYGDVSGFSDNPAEVINQTRGVVSAATVAATATPAATATATPAAIATATPAATATATPAAN